MENIKETRDKLQRLSEQLEERSSLRSQVNMSEESYIKYNAQVEKPSERSVTNESMAKLDNLSKESQIDKIKKDIKFQTTMSSKRVRIVAFVIIFLGAIFNLLITFIGAFFFVWSFLLSNEKKKNEQTLKELDVKMKQNLENGKKEDEENQRFNETEYPKLLKAYDDEVERLKPLYIEMHNSAKVRLDELEAEMAKQERIIADKYYEDIPAIIEIIDDGRAMSLPEAINLLISDKNADMLLNEQMRQTEIQAQAAEAQRRAAEAQRREMERHNRQMEAAAMEQASKIDYAKCHNCKAESYCRKTHCYGYRPK